MSAQSPEIANPIAHDLGVSCVCSDSFFSELGVSENSATDILKLYAQFAQHSPHLQEADQEFDPFLTLTVEQSHLVEEGLFPLCQKARPRMRNWKQRDREKFSAVLSVVIANALRASHHPANKRVRYSRANGAYSGESPYWPDFLRTPTLKAVINALAARGFLVCQRGIYSPDDKRQSTFEATASLRDWWSANGIEAGHVVRFPTAPVVVLKGRKIEGRKTKPLMPYDCNDPQVAQMIRFGRAYNHFLSKHEILLDMPEAELEIMYRTPEKTGEPRPPINFSDKRLHRVFNNGTFEEGGRFTGAWWINVPAKYRDHLLIDGGQTVELDYSGCFLRMLYHLEGLEMENDPYDIPAIRELADKQGLNWEAVRSAIKSLTNIYLNAEPGSRIGYFPQVTKDLPKGVKTPKRVYKLIEEHHPPIAHRFQTGCGLELMRYESDICSGILADGRREGIVVLPIYDSFIVGREHKAWLDKAMTKNYRERLGFDPKIKEKGGRLLAVDQPLKAELPKFSIGGNVSDVDRSSIPLSAFRPIDGAKASLWDAIRVARSEAASAENGL